MIPIDDMMGIIATEAWEQIEMDRIEKRKLLNRPVSPDAQEVAREIVRQTVYGGRIPCECEDFTCEHWEDTLANRIAAAIENAKPKVSEDDENTAREIAERLYKGEYTMLRLEREIEAYGASQREEQQHCDHCSGDLDGVRHILCEKDYRKFAGPKWWDDGFNGEISSDDRMAYDAGALAERERIRGVVEKMRDNWSASARMKDELGAYREAMLNTVLAAINGQPVGGGGEQ